jgi:amino acid transporter
MAGQHHHHPPPPNKAMKPPMTPEPLNARQVLLLRKAAKEKEARMAATGILLRHAAFLGTPKLAALLGPTRRADPDKADSVCTFALCNFYTHLYIVILLLLLLLLLLLMIIVGVGSLKKDMVSLMLCVLLCFLFVFFYIYILFFIHNSPPLSQKLEMLLYSRV